MPERRRADGRHRPFRARTCPPIFSRWPRRIAHGSPCTTRRAHGRSTPR